MQEKSLSEIDNKVVKKLLEDILALIKKQEKRNRTFHTLHMLVFNEILKTSPDLHLEITQALEELELTASSSLFDKEAIKGYIEAMKVPVDG